MILSKIKRKNNNIYFDALFLLFYLRKTSGVIYHLYHHRRFVATTCVVSKFDEYKICSFPILVWELDLATSWQPHNSLPEFPKVLKFSTWVWNVFERCVLNTKVKLPREASCFSKRTKGNFPAQMWLKNLTQESDLKFLC